MTIRRRRGETPPDPPSHDYDPLTPEEFKRLVEEATEQGEPTTPLVKRLVMTTIDELSVQLRGESVARSEKLGPAPPRR